MQKTTYRKKNFCCRRLSEEPHIGSRVVSAYYDGLVDCLPEYCVDVQVINYCNLYFERYNFFIQLIEEVKSQIVFQPSSTSLIIHPDAFRLKVFIELSKCYVFHETAIYRAFKRHFTL